MEAYFQLQCWFHLRRQRQRNAHYTTHKRVSNFNRYIKTKVAFILIWSKYCTIKIWLFVLNLYIFWIFCSFWETGMCWSTSIINQCGWRISVASDFISLWLVLVNYNRILHFVFLPWRVIFITFQPFLWSVIKIKQSGIRNSEEVSHILKTNYITFTCVVYFILTKFQIINIFSMLFFS